jgi:hypothetical protein
MSDTGFGNVDLTALDQMLASLGQQSAPTPAAVVPTFADNSGQARIQAEREAAADVPVIVSNNKGAANPGGSTLITDTPMREIPAVMKKMMRVERQPKNGEYGLLMNVKMPVTL